MTDPNGLRLFDIEKEAYSSPDGKYMEYLFKPMDSEIPEEKLSYVKGLPEWEWIIGAGIYKKIPTLQIETDKANYYKSFNYKILIISIIALFLSTLSYFIMRVIGNRLSGQVNLLKDSLSKVTKMDELIKLDNIRFGKFRQIGSSVNQMISEKKELELKPGNEAGPAN